MIKIFVVALICAISVEAFMPVPSGTHDVRMKMNLNNSNNGEVINMESLTKAVVASVLSLSLVFGTTSPALADGE